MNTARKCALVFGSKVYVAWKHLILRDVIDGHQAHIHRKKDGLMGHPVLQLAKTTLGSRAAHDIRDLKIRGRGARTATGVDEED